MGPLPGNTCATPQLQSPPPCEACHNGHKRCESDMARGGTAACEARVTLDPSSCSSGSAGPMQSFKIPLRSLGLYT